MKNSSNPNNGEALIDQLVDGELPPEERRDLLTSLDEQPDGWRRCALAFLEAQSWRDALSDAAIETNKVRPTNLRVVPGTSIGYVRWGTTLLAMAASFALAFALGTFFRGAAPTNETSPDSTQVAQDQPDVEGQNVHEPAAQETITLAMDGDESEQMVELPLVDAANVDPNWLATDQHPFLPANIVQAFEQLGHEVKQHRQFLPVDLLDGRQAVVPVDQVELRYVGRPTYQ